MSTQDWWHLKSEVHRRLATNSLSPSTELVDRIILAARNRAVAQAGSWWPSGPSGLARASRRQIKAASLALETDRKLEYVDQAIAARLHEWSNGHVRSAAPGLLTRLADACDELARTAALGEADRRALRRSARRTLRARLSTLDEHLIGTDEVSPVELEDILDETVRKVRTLGLARLSVRAEAVELAASFPSWLLDTVMEIVDHADFDLGRFDGDLATVFERELRRARSRRGYLFDPEIEVELEQVYAALRSESLADRTTAKVVSFGRARGHRLDLVGITAHVLDRAERSVERAWTFRDKLLLGAHGIDNVEAYAWRVITQQLTSWTAEYSAIGPPLSALTYVELENVAGPEVGSTTEAWFRAAERIARRAIAVLMRGGIELAGAIEDALSLALHPKQRTAFWEVIELSVVVKRLELELLEPRAGAAAVDRGAGVLDGLARLRAIVESDGGTELKLLVHKARCLLDAEWRAQYPNPSQLPDSEDPEHFARYQVVRRRTTGQESSPNPIIAGGVARLLSGFHHDILTAFGEETPE